MPFHVEMIPNYRIAYVRNVGPYGQGNTQAMEQLKQWAEQKDLLTKSAILFGIPRDNPVTTLPEDCRYDACIVISTDIEVDGDCVCEGELSGGKYAIWKIKHTAEDVKQAWLDIFPAIQSSGYELDNRPILERYKGELLINDFCEICVPVKSV
ncbi:GyrI-like domain-containing protein [Paenibacillus sp. N1-5-1-14]|uniref:AraC family transcriptional regulator n=1 Tax=Paenibacillus radicibacter TaxID=2972488 RepID=UPI002158B810|nr:GyrI-like domain-containing protein [Paenibacillus radicibacter]MCR8643506.1 GyrI-like domain-containing protein [Paenibacillus radicibacter]